MEVSHMSGSVMRVIGYILISVGIIVILNPVPHVSR
jgi:hypothetical protein